MFSLRNPPSPTPPNKTFAFKKLRIPSRANRANAARSKTKLPCSGHNSCGRNAVSVSGGGAGGGAGRTPFRATDQDGDGPNRHGFVHGIAVLAITKIVLPMGSTARAEDSAPKSLSIIVPVLNEEQCIESIINYLKNLDPMPAEIIVVDGGSRDKTVNIARRLGVTVLLSQRGRAKQMNAGAGKSKGEHLCFLHADTEPPKDLVRAVDRALADRRVVLGGFVSYVDHNGRPFVFSTLNSLLKTWYVPFPFRPLSVVRGLRILFGDQALFCRKSDFQHLGGYNEELPIMEDADLCIRMHMEGGADFKSQNLKGRGHVRLVLNRVARTSGRRIGDWGAMKAMVIYNIIGLNWYFGASPEKLHELYNRLYKDSHR
ncbi:hypothetical protein BSKO_13818 [Bryopsis sp. KO-2023]|nr:hypothetical protein BSKO_13818 [Bryopsis sp. KO-2023]